MPIDTVYSVVSEVVEVSMDSIVTTAALKNAYDLYHNALSNILVIVGVVFAIKLILEIFVSKIYIDYKIKMEVLNLKQDISDLTKQVENFGTQYRNDFFYKQIEFNIKFAQALYEANGCKCNIPSFLHFYNALNYLVELEPNHKWYFSLLPIIVGVGQNWKSVSSNGANSLLNLFERVNDNINKMNFVSFSEKNRVTKDIKILCESIQLGNKRDGAADATSDEETTQATGDASGGETSQQTDVTSDEEKAP